MTKPTAPIPKKKHGRPSKREAPRLPLDEVDRLLVYGEASTHESTGLPTVRFPSHRELAARFGVSHSTIDDYASRHNCAKRREEVQTRAHAKADDQLADLKAKTIVLGNAEVMNIIDTVLLEMAAQLKDGKMRCDSVSDFVSVGKFKLLLGGHADSRTEVRGGLSLEAIQARHRELTDRTHSMAERGETDTPETTDSGDGGSEWTREPVAT